MKKENSKAVFLVLFLVALLFGTASCKKEEPIVEEPVETGSIFIDTISIAGQTLVIKNTKQTDHDLNNFRITLGYQSAGYSGGIHWTTSVIVPSQGSLILTPADVGMILFEHDETFPLFARFFDETDTQFQEYLDD